MTANLSQKHEFQTEVKQLLNIVINSLYTEREVFLRELISNASDALEKIRYLQITSQDILYPHLELDIRLETDAETHTLSITDTGVGMTQEELIENLGTIAHSGSKQFLQSLSEGLSSDLNLIGQFGVGFYSAFMAAQKVTVHTRSYQPDAQGYIWESDGIGEYTIAEAPDLPRGTRIILTLKDDAHSFSEKDTVTRIIKQYSSFVPYPILVNGEKVNTIQAIWTKNKNEIQDEEYTEFYKFLANAYDEPFLRLHFSAEAPLSINALLFLPQDNFERYGFGRTEPGVNVYCKKVLIMEHAKDILPEWLRFVKGIIDSEELPLNISRETMQDSALVAKINRVVTKQLLKYLEDTADSEPERYREFWGKFNMFLKEGAASDATHREPLTRLLRFTSSQTEPEQWTSLPDYVSRLPEGQEEIYYINGPSRETIQASPYLEAFRDKQIEVLFTYDPIDDYIFNMLGMFDGKRLVSADQAELNLPGEAVTTEKEPLSAEALSDFAQWLKDVLQDKVSEVRASARLVESPAIVLNPHTSYSMQRMMQLMHKDTFPSAPGILEINDRHPIIHRLNAMRSTDAEFAQLAAEQLLENAQIAAGLILDPRTMVQRLNTILEKALNLS
ncbi:MAG: molecular chaperone HtpG [Peptococcaceae bacterium]|jgi:molecular chaperone HtpG|nr:molecular chaperone HtpG [Peptococcaceae bacterium]